jgi:hypothetical protein
VLTLWAEGDFVFAQETDETVGTNTMLKGFGMRLVQVRSHISDIGQIAKLLLAVPACSLILAFQIARIHVNIIIHNRAAFFYLIVHSRVTSHSFVVSRIKIGHDKFTRKARKSRTTLTTLIRIIVVALSPIDTKELPVKACIFGTVFFRLVLTQTTGVGIRTGIRRRTVTVVHLMTIDLAHNTSPTVKAMIFTAGHLGDFTQSAVKAGTALAVHVLLVIRIGRGVVPELVVLLHFGRWLAAQHARAVFTTFEVAVGNSSRFELTVLAFVTAVADAGVARVTVFMYVCMYVLRSNEWERAKGKIEWDDKIWILFPPGSRIPPGNSSAAVAVFIQDYRHDTTLTRLELNWHRRSFDLRIIRAALSLMQAEVIVRIRAKVGGFVFAVFAFVHVAFLVKGVFAVAKELFVPERIKKSVDTLSSVVTLVVPGTGLEDGVAQDACPSVRTVAVHITHFLVGVKVKVRTVVLLSVIGKGCGSDDAGIVSAVQGTQGAICLSLRLRNNTTAQGGDGSS